MTKKNPEIKEWENRRSQSVSKKDKELYSTCEPPRWSLAVTAGDCKFKKEKKKQTPAEVIESPTIPMEIAAVTDVRKRSPFGRS